jgi:hypothetical protein
LTSSVYDGTGTISGALGFLGGVNATSMPLFGNQWQLISYGYSGGVFTGSVNGVRHCSLTGGLHIDWGNSTDTYFGRDSISGWYKGALGRVAIYKRTALGLPALASLYNAGMEDGVREVRISAGNVTRAVEARAVGQVELARWSRVITTVAFETFVATLTPGGALAWQLGDTVPITLTQGGSGRTFTGSAKIQAINLDALGGQTLRWSIECEAQRFSLIDFWRQLVRQQTPVPGQVGATIAVAAAFDATGNQVLLIDGPCTASGNYSSLFVVAPDYAAQAVMGQSPFARVEFSLTQQNKFD